MPIYIILVFVVTKINFFNFSIYFSGYNNYNLSINLMSIEVRCIKFERSKNMNNNNNN